MKLSEGLYNFLQARKTPNNANLIDRWSIEMETQVNSAADNGEPVDGKRGTYTDDEFTWWNIRIPKNAADDPEFKDYELRFPLDLHTEGIGMTGWNWATRRSLWSAFDFDSLTGHAKGVGLSDAELERVKQAAMALPYVEVRKSTGGAGIHLYVYFSGDGIPTENHTVHAALARCVLGMMSSACGFDFASRIDACGHNMWFYHRKMTEENEGLKILKPAEITFSPADLPANWRDHIEVVTRRRAKVRIGGILDEVLDPFEALTSSRLIVPLDDTHKQMIEELQQSGYSTIWVPDHHLCQTHTCALAKLMESGKYRGILRTNSPGNNPGAPNCFWFPQLNGAIKVYRFSPGVQEAETWTQDREGWTWCYFNRKPNLTTACRAIGGIEDEKGGYVFNSFDEAKSAAELVGAKIEVDSKYSQRPTKLKSHNDGRLVTEIERSESDAPLPGYIAKKNKFVKIFDTVVEEKKEESGCELDNIVRHLETIKGDDAGYMVKKNGRWGHESYTNAKNALLRSGIPKAQVEMALGQSVLMPWEVVNCPFQPEYPGGRRWNYGAAQFVYPPVVLDDDEVPHHPHWDLIINHFFGSLTPFLQNLQWAKEAAIYIGGDWGRLWIACLLRDPFEPLPYVFAYGPENSGKSILHEAIALLVTAGIVAADRVLTTKGDFCGELENAILCYVEEQQLANNPAVMGKIKDLVTSKTVSIRKMKTDTFQQPSTLHFLQLSNWFHAYPVFQGDTRAMVMEVPPFTGVEIPKKELLAKLKEESPHFMRTIMDLELPTPQGRLRLPAVETTDKTELADEMAPIGRFLDDCCELGPHRVIKVQLYNAYNMWAIENGFEALPINQFGGQLRAVSKNKIRAKGQKNDEDGKKKHCYTGVCLRNAV